MGSVAGADVGGKQSQYDEVQYEGNEDEVIHDADEWNGEIDRIEGVETEQNEGGQEPKGPAGVPQCKADEPQVVGTEPPEPQEAKHEPSCAGGPGGFKGTDERYTERCTDE